MQLGLIVFCPGGIWALPYPLFPDLAVLSKFNFGFVYLDDLDAMYRVPFFDDLAINYSRWALCSVEYPRYSSGPGV